jgi:hypothetical protein
MHFIDSVRWTLSAVGSWLAGASPWIQGLFGGAGATLLWEGFLKPRRERRSLTHVLAEEVALNLELGANHIEWFNHNPKGVPQDFRFLTTVYESVAERLGALPTRLVGEIVLLYAGMDAVNRIPSHFAHALERRDEMRMEQGRLQGPGVFAKISVAARETELEMQLKTFRNGLEKAFERANRILPKLRRASISTWRLDQRFRKKSYLSVDQIKQNVAGHAERLGLPDVPQA